jgi:pimeloyl-ACP methyl ester carboxylesterase
VRGTGEPLLLVHGTGNSLHVWDPVVERLAARMTVIAVDLPGFGASPPLTSAGPPPAPAGFAGVLTDFLGQLGHSTAHIAGHSVGGWTALEMAKLGACRPTSCSPCALRASCAGSSTLSRRPCSRDPWGAGY